MWTYASGTRITFVIIHSPFVVWTQPFLQVFCYTFPPVFPTWRCQTQPCTKPQPHVLIEPEIALRLTCNRLKSSKREIFDAAEGERRGWWERRGPEAEQIQLQKKKKKRGPKDFKEPRFYGNSVVLLWNPPPPTQSLCLNMHTSETHS